MKGAGDAGTSSSHGLTLLKLKLCQQAVSPEPNGRRAKTMSTSSLERFSFYIRSPVPYQVSQLSPEHRTRCMPSRRIKAYTYVRYGDLRDVVEDLVAEVGKLSAALQTRRTCWRSVHGTPPTLKLTYRAYIRSSQRTITQLITATVVEFLRGRTRLAVQGMRSSRHCTKNRTSRTLRLLAVIRSPRGCTD